MEARAPLVPGVVIDDTIWSISFLGMNSDDLVSHIINNADSVDELLQELQEASIAHGFDPTRCLAEYILKSKTPSILYQLRSYSFTKDRQFLSGLKEIIRENYENGIGYDLDVIEGILLRAKVLYLCSRHGLQFSEQLLESIHTKEGYPRAASACPFANRKMTDTQLPLIQEHFDVDNVTVNILSRPSLYWSVDYDGCPLMIVDAIVSPDKIGIVYCTEYATMALEKGTCPELDRLVGITTLRAADMLRLGVCRGMIPRAVAHRITKITPYMFHIMNAVEAFRLLSKMIEQKVEYPGPDKISLLLEESTKHPRLSSAELQEHIERVYPCLL